MDEVPSRYNPQASEDRWYKFWEENNLFSAKPNPTKKPFCIVIPPPNITGILHMGHALNNTIQDILIRYHRMKGEEALWMPGTDHAGIATQNVVEKAIAKEGLKRQDLGRDKFIARVWQWKEQYGSTIIHQLKKLGASCDWSRTRFTMDEAYSRSVKYVFIYLWEKGLIYQDNKVISWCPHCQTALSDEEAPHRELQGSLYYLRYPLKQGLSQKGTIPAYLVVATTRPETMLGDTAVAVNPKDKRYKKLIGKSLILPLANREIKIIADEMIDMKFGTGVVKVTPAHDPNDYLLGKKHKLEFINLMQPDGRMSEAAGDYAGMDRFEAREVVLEDLKEKGLLEKVEPHQLSAGHCYRCHTIIEPYLSRQWFVKMKPLAKPALEAVKNGKIKFYPKRWERVYLNWMQNLQDWCISRQIWWGHRIPLWYCLDCKKETQASIDKPLACRVCNSVNLVQDKDVLDTWFSSWLWPFATFGWPFQLSANSYQLTANEKPKAESRKLKADLDYFYPTSVLVTAPEIIFFWVARMIMAGFEFIGKEPFSDVYIHGTVRDIEGKKMSKSLGNIIDPLEIIQEYGTDALRFSLVSITAEGQDVNLTKERFQQGRNFANKIWNAFRFISMNLNPAQLNQDLCLYLKKENLSLVNRWILSRFYSLLKEVNRNLESYRFNEASRALYSFFWHEFCDWYLELVKPILAHSSQFIDHSKEKENTQVVMYEVLEKFLSVLHPFMPFITEEIWQRLQQSLGGVSPSSIMVQSWPQVQAGLIDKKTEKEAKGVFEIITQIRNLRSSLEVKPEEKVKVSFYAHNKVKYKLIQENSPLVMNLAKVEELKALTSNKPPEASVSAVIEGLDLYLHFSGLLDISGEREKFNKKIAERRNVLSAKKERLKDADFFKNAPKEIVEKEKDALLKLTEELIRLEKMRDELS